MVWSWFDPNEELRTSETSTLFYIKLFINNYEPYVIYETIRYTSMFLVQLR